MKLGAVRDYLLAEGYRASVTHEDESSTCIVSGVSGFEFMIVFFRFEPFDGDLDSYHSILFSAGLTIDGPPNYQKLNEANCDSHLLKATYELDGVWVELGVPVPDEGLPDGMFEEYFERWAGELPEFVQQLI